MADSIRRVSYYYTTISDKPGEGARLLETFRSAGVNLLAFHAFPSARKAQVDFVPSDSALFTAAAKGAKIKLSKPKTAFLIDGDDRVGALAGILARLGARSEEHKSELQSQSNLVCRLLLEKKKKQKTKKIRSKRGLAYYIQRSMLVSTLN